MNDLTDAIVQSLKNKADIVIATIVARTGSSPRQSGASLMVNLDGSSLGTVGGGLLEAEVIQSAHRMLKSQRTELLKFDLNQQYMATGAMICGGYSEVLVNYVEATQENLAVFQTIQQHKKKGQLSYLVTWLEENEDSTFNSFCCLLGKDKNVFGNKSLDKSSITELGEMSQKLKSPEWITIQDREFWVEPLQCSKKLFLFGAGHVSRPTANLAATTHFQVTVLDDRETYASKEHFTDPVEVFVLPDFENCLHDLNIDENSFLVCVTRGHLHDKAVLAQALKTNACYIGMIGSRKKRDTLYGELLKEGFTQQDLDRVHCPIGLKIGADSPEEIAVSIVAELIEVRSTL
jgi:xanthine dehydrogenase accessory factor